MLTFMIDHLWQAWVPLEKLHKSAFAGSDVLLLPTLEFFMQGLLYLVAGGHPIYDLCSSSVLQAILKFL